MSEAMTHEMTRKMAKYKRIMKAEMDEKA